MLVREVKHLGVAYAKEVVSLWQKGEVQWLRDGQDVLAIAHAEVSEDGQRVIVEGDLLSHEWGYEVYDDFFYTYPLHETLSLVTVTERDARNWQECLPMEYQNGSRPWSEEVVWQAIADFSDLDVSEIADGDLTEYL